MISVKANSQASPNERPISKVAWEQEGLTTAQVAQAMQSGGRNVLPGQEPKSFMAICLEVITEPMFLMLVVAGGLYLILGDRAEAIFLLGSVFVIIGMTIFQQRKTQRALDALRDLSAPRALVIRDGKETRISGSDVVQGDVLILHEGDRVPADSTLLDGKLDIDESLLTGESVPVTKFSEGGEQGALFASTVVTRGVGIAKVTAIGVNTAVGRIGAELIATKEPPSKLQSHSRRLVRLLGLIALLLALSQALLGWWWNHQPMVESLLLGIALAMALLPEEIPVVITVFLALGAWRIARHRVLTRRVSSVEALGGITMLAVDKTGTLTENRMVVAEVATIDQTFTKDAANPMPEAFHALVEFAMLATPEDPFDPMEKAIQHFGHVWLDGTEHVHDGRQPEFEYSLSPDILAMTRVYASHQPDHHLLATKGAPEAVMDLCHLSDVQRHAIARQVEYMAERGLRVLAVARGLWREPEGRRAPGTDWPDSQHDFDFEYLGLVALYDPPRPEVADAIRMCKRAGIRVLMMTGDHPATAWAIAKQVGLSSNPEVLTGAEVMSLDKQQLMAKLNTLDVCARLKPEHKLRLVEALRQSGEVVAMTGDGVNDGPALKAADIGIAMGERGTDVAREAASLVLLNDSFASIVEAIRQGRRIDANIRKAVRFIIAVHIPVIALAMMPTLFHWMVLLMPVHIVLLELLIDPACAVVFEAESEDQGLMDRPPRASTDSPFSGIQLMSGLLQGLGVTAVLLAGKWWGDSNDWSDDQVRTVVYLSLLLSVMLLIWTNRSVSARLGGLGRANNPFWWWMVAGVGVTWAALAYVPWIRRLMGFSAPGAAELSAMAVLVLGVFAWLLIVRGLFGLRPGGGIQSSFNA